MNKFIDTATELARESGDLLRDIFGQTRQVQYKGEIDLVTDADLRAEKLIAGGLHKRYPDHAVVSEEEESYSGTAAYTWFIDPLDGTTNYAHGFPWFCVSIALNADDETVLGVVYHPMLNHLFQAEKGGGAHLNGERISVSNTHELGESLLATGFAYSIHEKPEPAVSQFKNFLIKVRGIRRAGSAALDLCYVANGCFAGFWEMNLKPWDTAAGALIVREAGGTVTDFENRSFSPFSRTILATNGRVHKDMIEIIRSTR
ncbi:MAG: inositol monophosphatase family protein [Pseudomonadota bacterium]